MTHPEMVSAVDDNKGGSLIRTVLLVVPVNTIANWENGQCYGLRLIDDELSLTATNDFLHCLEPSEFAIWQKNLLRSVVVSNLGDVTADARASTIRRWSDNGGILLVSDMTLASIASKKNGENVWEKYCEADVLVMDEAHTMLRKSANKVYKALAAVTTPRKIGKCRSDRGLNLRTDQRPLTL